MQGAGASHLAVQMSRCLPPGSADDGRADNCCNKEKRETSKFLEQVQTVNSRWGCSPSAEGATSHWEQNFTSLAWHGMLGGLLLPHKAGSLGGLLLLLLPLLPHRRLLTSRLGSPRAACSIGIPRIRGGRKSGGSSLQFTQSCPAPCPPRGPCP